MFLRGTAHGIRLLAFAVLLFTGVHEARGYTPGTASPAAVSGFVVNGLDRRDVLVFYNCAYTASEGYAGNMAWNGSVAGCVPGTTIVSNGTTNVGDNTIVWEPAGLPALVTNDVTYDITVSGITGAGVPASYSYSVTLFNPDLLGDSVTITGTNTPFTTGSGYTFNSITQADQYELKVSQGSSAAWTEGAEDAPAPHILSTTAASYSLRQTAVKRTGSKGFHLTFGSINDGDQTFEIDRDIVPSASSNLLFSDLFRFVAMESRLSAEISTDNGNSWTELWGRIGNGIEDSSGWDTAFQNRSVSLAAYSGSPIRVRFIFTPGNFVFLGTDAFTGVFLDDITVTNATELVNTTATPLAGAATSFTLNGTTAGAALVAGTSYYMRVRPNVGLRWYGFGALKSVTAQTPTGYAGWVATQYPAVTGGSLADHDQDGIRNGVEYAFSLNPTAFTPGASLPQPVLAGGNLTLSYTPPVGVTGVTYGAEWSQNLQDWFPVTDTGAGAGGQRVFSVSTAGKVRLFMRHKIAIAP